MKKILIVITTGFVEYGGLTNVMMNYFKALDKKDLQIDFASTNVPDNSDAAYKFIINNGSKYYCLGNRKKNLFTYLKHLKQLIKEHNYDVIHVNGNSATMFFELYVAKKLKVQTRIAHGHTTRSNHPFLHMILKKILKKYYTHAIAVSKSTGQWLFNDNYIILNNAIDVEKYQYNINVREKIRKKMNLKNFTVIGNVGKLYKPKNQKFLIDIFSYYHEINMNSILIIVGGGHLEKDLKKYALEKGLENDIIFLGMRNDIQDILQSFDIFVFPSLYEGLGLALIEAQASGLQCIASDVVPLETKVTNNIIYYSLNSSAEEWAKVIHKIDYSNRKIDATTAINSIRLHGYDIKNEAKKLNEIYMFENKK